MTDLKYSIGDTAPKLTLTCFADKMGRVRASLSNTTVSVHVTRPDDTVIIRPGDIEGDPLLGEVSFDWVTGDLNQVGRYFVDVKVTYSNGDIQTFGTVTFEVKD